MSLATMTRRLEYQGGAATQNRMIRDKLKAMLLASKRSYQAARFLKYPGFEAESIGLFNPINQTERFDTKMMSVPFEAGYQVGDIFRWVNTDTLWIIFLRELTELAYFRGECRRCDHQIEWIDGDQQKRSIPVSVIGPSNPSLRTMASINMNAGVDFNTSSIRILVQDNPLNRGFFHRYQRLLLQGIGYKVENLDTLSMPGIIQLYATEDAVDRVDNDVENNIRNAWNVLPIVTEHPTAFMIEGPGVVKPLQSVQFTIMVSGGDWFIVENDGLPQNQQRPAILTDVSDREVTITWNNSRSGNYTIGYKMPNGHVHQRHIIVESLM